MKTKIILFIFGIMVYAAPLYAASYAGAVADQGQNQSINNSFNSADPIRQMPYPTAPPVAMRGGPSYFAAPSMDMGP